MATATPIQVACRLRPRKSDEPSVVEVKADTITVGDNNPVTVNAAYSGSASDEEVYSRSMAPLVTKVLQGYNAFVIAYGGSATGKAYTMTGESIEHIGGLVARSIDSLFDRIEDGKRQGTKYFVTVSMFQIRRGFIVDLLNPCPKTTLYLKDHRSLGVYVEGLAALQASSAVEAKEYFTQGLRVKSQMLRRSTNIGKPHIMMDISIESQEVNSGTIKQSLLRFSQCASSGGVSFRFNIGLQALSKCIDSLAEEQSAWSVPYASSNFTRLLEPGLGGNALCLFLMFIDSRERTAADSLRTLETGSKLIGIKHKAEVNINHSKDTLSKIRTDIAQSRIRLNLQQPGQWMQDIDVHLLENMKQLTSELERVKASTWTKMAQESERIKKARLVNLKREGLSLALTQIREVPQELSDQKSIRLNATIKRINDVAALNKTLIRARRDYVSFRRIAAAKRKAVDSNDDDVDNMVEQRSNAEIQQAAQLGKQEEELSDLQTTLSDAMGQFEGVLSEIIEIEMEKKKADALRKSLERKQDLGEQKAKQDKISKEMAHWKAMKLAMKRDRSLQQDLTQAGQKFQQRETNISSAYSSLQGPNDKREQLKKAAHLRSREMKAQEEQIAVLKWERNKIWSRFLEQNTRHKVQLKRLEKHMFAMFANYRQHFEEQKQKVEGRYRELLENSVTDGLKLTEENNRLRQLIEKRINQIQI